MERPDFAVLAGREGLSEIPLDGSVAAEARETTEHEPHDIVVDRRRREHRVEILRRAGHALDVGAAERGHDRLGLRAIDGDRGATDDDEQRDQCDDDELVAGPHLGAG